MRIGATPLHPACGTLPTRVTISTPGMPEPRISSACRSTSAATAAASTWGRRPSASRGSPSSSPALGVDGDRQGRHPVAAARERRAPAIRASATSARSPGSASSSTSALARRRCTKARCRSCSAATTRWAPDRWPRPRPGCKSQGHAARPDLGRRARRHQLPAHVALGQRARHAAGGAARPRAAWSWPASRGPDAAIRPEHTVLVGIRNLDDREKEIVRASGVHAFTMKDIDRLGIAEVMERALAAAVGRHRRRARVVRPRRVRSGDCARRRHAGEGRPRLPRGALRDGGGGRIGPAWWRSTWSR